MESQEAEKHHGNYTTEEYSDCEGFMLVLQVRDDDPHISFISMALRRCENFVPEITLVNEVIAAVIAYNNTVYADQSMR